MPGESLSKYGGAPAEGAVKPAAQPPAPARPASSFKPATLIESPLQWDGSGLLPGESLSRHRSRAAEPAAQAEAEAAKELLPETQAVAPQQAGFDAEEQEFFVETIEDGLEELEAEEESAYSPEIVEEELVSQWTKAALADEELTSEEALEEEEFEEKAEAVSESDEQGAQVQRRTSQTPPPLTTWTRSLPPASVSLASARRRKRARRPPSRSHVRSGQGTHRGRDHRGRGVRRSPPAQRAQGGDHDSDDFEEETLPNQLRTGDLGEMLQEAHLDHRIH